MKANPPESRARLFFAVAIVLTALACPALAGEGRAGMCFSFLVQSADYRGDLRDSRVLWHFEKAFAIPRPDSGYALGVSLGYRTEKGSWDVSYLRSSHRSVFPDDVQATANMHILEINGRSYFIRRSAFHPYFLGGISLPVLHIPGGAKYQGRTYDATYLGGGLNIGAGLAVDVGPKIVLTAGAAGRALWFLYAFGGGKGRDINHLTVGFGGPKFGRLLQTFDLSLTFALGFIL